MMDAREVSADHRIRPDTVVQQATRMFQCLVLNVNQHFEDLSI